MKNEELVTNNIGLAYSIAIQFNNCFIEREELNSVALFGLTKAADTFDYSKGYKFSTYATKVMTNEILMFIRNNKKYNNLVSLNCNVYENSELNEVIVDEKVNVEQKSIDSVLINEINDIIDTLSKREKSMLYLSIYKEYSTVKIAEIFNVSQSYVSRILKNTYQKIKHDLLKENIKSLDYKIKK